MAHDQDPLDDAPDPTEDTPEDESQDTAEAEADSGPSDWTPKDRTEATRKITELAQENARLRREAEARKSSAPDEADGEVVTGDYLAEQNALLAGEVFGPEATQAAETVWELLEAAETTADYMAVLEGYHQARLGGGNTGAPAGDGKPTREQAIQPRVDSNRTDRAPDSDDQLAEARKSGSLGAFTNAAAAALGFGPSKR